MLRRQLQPWLLSALCATFPLHRCLLYSTSSGRFVVEDYLVDTCGLTPAQARKASKYLHHLKSPEKPDAVRTFLAGFGVSKADVATAITRDTRLLCSSVDKTLTPQFAQLREIGLSPAEISRLMTIFPRITPLRISRIAFYLSFLGSYDKVHTAIRSSAYLLSTDVDNVVKPNIELLLQCGLTPGDVATLCSRVPVLFTKEPERVMEVVARADKLGVPRNSAMFKRALEIVHNQNPRTISAKMDFLKKALACSESEVAIAICQMPPLLAASVGKLGRVVEFLKVDVGLEPGYIVRRPQLFSLSVEKRLIPRHYVIKVLKAKGLVKKDIDFHSVVCLNEERFAERMLERHKESVPGLAGAYAAACAGQVPSEIEL
ncbi:unnamed protein product [Urochloa decumbens]|uniref:Uncharacterized protein n=1 Tax=Urochloa decumbens TaxID=240449 RepID=A0ABC8ZUC9_9POAL